jgi:hypothetical protein
MRVLGALVVLFLTPLAMSSNCGVGGGQCEDCVACVNAITLTVTDEDGNEPQGWVMEATQDGEVVDDFGACDEDVRVGGTCSFGVEAGLYRIVVRAPGFETREIAARFASSNCCQCLVGINVNAVLERAE